MMIQIVAQQPFLDPLFRKRLIARRAIQRFVSSDCFSRYCSRPQPPDFATVNFKLPLNNHYTNASSVGNAQASGL